MTFAQWDLVIRIAAATTIALLALLLLGRRKDVGVPARIFPLLAICLTGFLAGNTPDPSLRIAGPTATLANLASGFTVIFLWWFCLSCFERHFRPRGFMLAVSIAWATIAAADRGLFGAKLADSDLSRLLVVLGFGIVAHLVWRLLAERSGDLVQARRDARVTVSTLLGGLLFVDLSVDVLFGFDWRPLPFAMAQNSAILGTGMWLAGTLLAVRADVLTFSDKPAPTHPAESPGSAIEQRLWRLMNQERIFLDPELTLADFVQRMHAPERAVRSLINHKLGFDHFRTFLNHHRVAEACRLLDDPARRDDKLIAIALDSGFASLPSFNRAFKTIQRQSPSAYREAAPQSGPAPPFEQRSAGF